MSSKEHKFQNRLANSFSPYLRQHAHNPVDWYPWGEEAFEKARQEDKPIFLSIGYAACHWCHVMERESFVDENVATFLNEHFVSIKVDREERPDIDEIYMSAVHAINGSGGWPMTIFLDGDLRPFYGGTYYPPIDSYGRMSFPKLLELIYAAWYQRRGDVLNIAHKITTALNEHNKRYREVEEVTLENIDRTARLLAESYDQVNGGFGAEPKFPPTGQLRLLLKLGKNKRIENAYSSIIEKTVKKMSNGGLYDHIGGGFFRYTVDAGWLIPHFEKMLYDNALIINLFSDVYKIDPTNLLLETLKSSADWMLREMLDENGGFWSSIDADSEGVEGKFYLWTYDEIHSVLSQDDAEMFCQVYNIIKDGSFEHNTNHLNMATLYTVKQAQGELSDMEFEERLKTCRDKLLLERSKRVRPFTDKKILTDWNGLAIAALANLCTLKGCEHYLTSSQRAADFILSEMWSENSGLKHRYFEGDKDIDGLLEDYAYFLWGLVELYQTDFNPKWIDFAEKIANQMLEYFWDNNSAGFFMSKSDRSDLILNPKNCHDNALPSGNAIAALVFHKLGQINNSDKWHSYGREIIQHFAEKIVSNPTAHVRLVEAVLLYQTPSKLGCIVEGNDNNLREMLRIIKEANDSNLLMVVKRKNNSSDWEVLKGKEAIEGKTTYYYCIDKECKSPVNSLEQLNKAIFRENT